MNTPTFDLVEIVKVVQRNFKAIAGITIAATLLGAVSHLIKDKEYTANAETYMLNPMYGDRNNIQRHTENLRFVDYFGTEGDVDKAMTMIESKDVQDSVLIAADLYKAWQLDPAKPKDRLAAEQRYKSSFEVKRTENISIMCSFTDTDPERAAKTLDMIVSVTDDKFRKYIAKVKVNAREQILGRTQMLEQQIQVYTDSLAHLRDQYKIYDILNPTRENLIVGSVSGAGKVNAGEGVEKIQNLETLKDQLVIAHAELSAAALEFETSGSDEVKILHYVSTPKPPVKASGLGLVLTALACAFGAFFFCVVLFSLTAYIKALSQTER
ncbi:MAG: Wzz/FepE/Etk N-terminal domain-containing protein [Chitinophagaceae bacterium]